MTAVGACGPELLFNDEGMAPVESFVQWALPRIPPQQAAYRLLQAIPAYIAFYRAQLDQAEALMGQVEAFFRQIGGQAWVEGHVTWLRLSLLLVRRDFPAFAAAVESAARARWRTA